MLYREVREVWERSNVIILLVVCEVESQEEGSR